MNKTAIKNFAVWARNKLITDITYKAGLIGVSEDEIANPLPQSSKDLQFFDIGTKEYTQVAENEIKQRDALVTAIQNKDSDYKTAFKTVIEEIAYTWFNRLIAIRFMEVNDYLPSRVRVLSSENSAKKEPDLVTTPFDSDLEFSFEEQEKIMQLKDENKLDDLFRMLFIKECNKLHEILPGLFEVTFDREGKKKVSKPFDPTTDYTELLLNVSFTDEDGVIYHLVHDIEEDDFNIEKEGQVEIIGWLYQYYNIEPKNETFALLKKNVKITKERIPAATQLFTPDWIVRYMVENSLGRLWIEGHPNDNLKESWKYYLEEAQQEVEVQAQIDKIRAEYKNISPENIKVIDPCMGSGHILVYCFDILMQIYESQGYTQRDAAQSILEHNLYGLDIDKRASQMAYFAVMMKARQYNRRILGKGIKPHVYVIKESNHIDNYAVEYFANGNQKIEKAIKTIVKEMYDAKEYGSILNISSQDWTALYTRFDEVKQDISLYRQTIMEDLLPVVQIAQALAQKYDVVVTNPPYMGASGMSARLSQYVKENYPDSKSDLFAVFMERCGQLVKKNCYQAMITQHAWMFLSSFEKLRNKLLALDTINMAHLGARAFEEIGGEVVQTTSFVFRKSHIKYYKAVYCRLIEPSTQKGKEDMFLVGENRYVFEQNNFSKIPGAPIAYWVSESILSAYKKGTLLGDCSDVKIGMGTGKNDIFVREWWEVSYDLIDFSLTSITEINKSEARYFPYNKGGEFRLWYGNLQEVLWFDSNGQKKMNTMSGHRENGGRDYYCKEGLTWSFISSSKFGIRFMPSGCFFDVAGSTLFSRQDNLYTLGFLASSVCSSILGILNPTLNYQAGNIKSLPLLSYNIELVDELVNENIGISKSDWDSFEASWDFVCHPLVRGKKKGLRLTDHYKAWEMECFNRFNALKTNEEKLNQIFIDNYDMQDELTPEVADKDITVRKAELQRDIKSLLSYAVGCMFGRYSLDIEGFAYAGGVWNDEKYKTYLPDEDNCVPITDEEYFEDDIVGRLVEFVKVVYGKETLEENLDFIAQALGNKGDTSREIIRNYFLNDFIKDHIKIYQKRPIYWLFDSGKQNGFKALVYMHRWNADTVGNLRVEYLHKIQRTYESEIIRMQEAIDNSQDSREVAHATKRKDKLQKQLKETKDYDAMLAHIALSRIDIVLDDGVKVNYEKVQTGRDRKKLPILTKI